MLKQITLAAIATAMIGATAAQANPLDNLVFPDGPIIMQDKSGVVTKDKQPTKPVFIKLKKASK